MQDNRVPELNNHSLSPTSKGSGTGQDVLQADSASLGYHGKTLVRDLTLSVKQGEILTLIGPNGAGKSTILKSLTRQLELTKGRVLLLGRDMKSIPASEQAEHMAVLLTERVQDGYLTAFDVAAMGRYPYTGRMGILSETDREMTSKALAYVHADDLARRPFSELSDGQKQRVLLARALNQEPDVLILDEPTSYLDIHYQMLLMDLLITFSREKQMTIILSLHEIDLAARISDRILAVKDDHTWIIGTPEEIFAGGQIEELFNLDGKRYDPVTGSFELKKAEGTPEVFVISSGGTGVPVYRELTRRRTPFAAGILYENDLDYHFAKKMAARVISEKPFRPLSASVINEADVLISRCRYVINAGIALGEDNAALSAMLSRAKKDNKLIPPKDLKKYLSNAS